jgi:hypothetical protein
VTNRAALLAGPPCRSAAEMIRLAPLLGLRPQIEVSDVASVTLTSN